MPFSVDNSRLPGFPPIADQGPINTCVPFATTYSMLTHEVNLRDGRPGNLAANRFSPKWAYNLVVPGSDTGTTINTVLALLRRHGAVSSSAMPYDTNVRAWPTNGADWEAGLAYRAGEAVLFPGVHETAGRDALKAWLAAGHVAVFESHITNWVYRTVSDDLSTTNDNTEIGKAIVSSVTGPSAQYHVMTVVGYHDGLWLDQNQNGVVDPGERGAFRIANSYGPGWRDSGFIWFSYDALLAVSAVAGGPTRIQGWTGALGPTARGITLRSTPPRLIARVRVRHPVRNQLLLQLGSSLATETTPSQTLSIDVPRQSGGAWAFDGTTTPVTATFAFDLTDIATTGQSARWYLTVTDVNPSGSAELFEFELVDRTRADTITRLTSGVPATIDNATQVFRIDYPF